MRTISTLNEERADLRKKIAAVSSRTSGPASFASGKTSGSSGSAVGGSFDWKTISSQLTGAGEGDVVSDMRAMMQFEQRLENMSKEEMIAALDEIAGLDLTKEARENLESMILDPLIQLDPALALAHFGDRIKDEADGIGWQLASALQNWAEKDLVAATVWFDREIAAGNFDSKTLDGRSELRMQYEGALLASLLESDPDAASQRLAAMPEDQRREVLQQMTFSELSEGSQKAYTALVRGLVPSAEREGSFAHIAGELVSNEGFSEVGNFLDGVNASTAERVAAAKEAADSHLEQLAENGKITAQEVDAMREWLARQAPGEKDRITGKALAEAAQGDGEFSFTEAAKLALTYNESSPNDDVLVAFLNSYAARSNLQQAEHLAGMIKDPKTREELLQQLK